MIDFSLTDELQEYQDRTRAFIREKIIPMESDPRQSPHGPSDELRLEVAALGREAGLLTPHIGEEWGGLGLPHIGKAIVFEEAGYSPLGAYALNISAPDEGNMHLLEVVGSEEQKEKYLRPLAAADIRSAFSMTEPDGGAGSDPSMMKVTAFENDDGYVINGRKWMITGADGAAFQIIMARTIDKSGEDIGATMFMADMNIEGCEVVRVLDTMDSNTSGGHSIVDYNDVRVPKESILGEAGKGFRYAQVRLAPARLTHCMRWLGAARLSRYRRRLRPQPPCLRQAALRARRRQLPTCRQFTGPAPEPPQHLAYGLGVGSGRARGQRKQYGESILLGGRRPRRRPFGANPGRYGHHERDRCYANLQGHSCLPHLRRPVRSPPLGHRAPHHAGKQVRIICAASPFDKLRVRLLFLILLKTSC